MSKVWVLDCGDGDITLYKTRAGALEGFRGFLENGLFTDDEREEAMKQMREVNCCEGYQIYTQKVWD